MLPKAEVIGRHCAASMSVTEVVGGLSVAHASASDAVLSAMIRVLAAEIEAAILRHDAASVSVDAVPSGARYGSN